MYEDLRGKTALVTGGTSGIGRAIVESMAAQGVHVIFTGRDRQKAEAVTSATGARFIPAEATDPEHGNQVATALHEFGIERLHVLVNNAGAMGWPQNVEQTTGDAFDHTVAVHLRAPWIMMNAALSFMKPWRAGSIVNMASIAGQRIGASSAAYSASKAALIHLTRLAAAEFGSSGIRVNSVSPGFVETDIHAQGVHGDHLRGQRFVEGLKKLFLSRQALPHVGQPRDIADMVLFLASDASAFVTGSDLVADGGVMWGRVGIS